MMKVKVFVHAKYEKHYSNETGKFINGITYNAWPIECDSWGTLVHETEIDVPQVDENEVINGTVKIMRAEQRKIRAEAEAKFQNIEQQIQEMLCLPGVAA
jgi:hypothetical protein